MKRWQSGAGFAQPLEGARGCGEGARAGVGTGPSGRRCRRGSLTALEEEDSAQQDDFRAPLYLYSGQFLGAVPDSAAPTNAFVGAVPDPTAPTNFSIFLNYKYQSSIFS